MDKLPPWFKKVDLKQFDSYDAFKEYIKSIKYINKESGVYILVDNSDEVVYVGGSYNLRQRLSQHPVIKEHFDEIKYVVMHKCDNVWKVERAISIKYRPKYCKEYNTKANKDKYGDNLYPHIKVNYVSLIANNIL